MFARHLFAWFFLSFNLSLTFADTIEFEGPDSAPIYVIEGDMKESGSISMMGGDWFYENDMQASMEVVSGSILCSGRSSTYGSFTANGVNVLAGMEFNIAAKGVVKQAGNSLRWSGSAAMSGPLVLKTGAGYPETWRTTGIWTYRNMMLDSLTGEQVGLMSYKASAVNAYGRKFPLVQTPKVTRIPRPTIYSSESDWREIAGVWSAEVRADVYPSGKIVGHGDLIVGPSSDPFSVVNQSIKGSMNRRTGVVGINGTGSSKATSKVRVTLNYLDSTGDTISGKSSINAYGQTRKF